MYIRVSQNMHRSTSKHAREGTEKLRCEGGYEFTLLYQSLPVYKGGLILFNRTSGISRIALNEVFHRRISLWKNKIVAKECHNDLLPLCNGFIEDTDNQRVIIHVRDVNDEPPYFINRPLPMQAVVQLNAPPTPPSLRCRPEILTLTTTFTISSSGTEPGQVRGGQEVRGGEDQRH
ncbi:hypothetical protein NQ317_012854 [Molorchus minor]|uniref:Cadherin domain-containing protein n=1 Tax=Molorchus minor TaxID=1323400 RepID=A0ABQ9IRY5_9CUCU|nr:hypothetical protein NQ317_012854 [Molorchus minor]